MYCKFCGKEIDQDSTFCKHCGADLSSDRYSSSTNLKGISNLKTWFTGMSKKKQICLMLYFLWFWIAFVIFSTERDFIVSFTIAVIIIPAALLMLWYAYSHKWFKWDRNTQNIESLTPPPLPPYRVHRSLQDRDTQNIESQLSDSVEENAVSEKIIIKTYPLTEFAAEHGKMQIQKDYDKKSCSYIVSYVFTNKNGNRTIVLPAEGLASLTAEEISKQKYVLCVNEYNNGSLRLDRRVFQRNPEEEYMPKLDD